MSWYYNGLLIENLPANTVGFVYEITNTLTGKKYIGKKLAEFSKTSYKMVLLKSGVKKRKRISSKIESDWRTYWSSSDELKEDVKQFGEHNFKREILHYCRSKSECSYLELKEQILRQVLESNDYYNSWISARIRKNHILKG
jgi:hypothetical protein